MNRFKLWLLRLMGYRLVTVHYEQHPYDRLASSMIYAMSFDELAPQIRCLCANTLQVLDLCTVRYPEQTEQLPDTLRSISTCPPSSPGPLIT
jgi:hypothetical protein